MKTLTKEAQSNITPALALKILKEGNKRFLNNATINRDLNLQVEQTSTGQYPFACILGCIDSRVPSELVFDQGFGDIFNVRIAGNFVNTDILGSMEFACKVAGSKIILVLGHTKCGAIKGACDHVKLGNLTAMLQNFDDVLDASEYAGDRSSQNSEFVDLVTHKNIEMTIDKIRKNSPVLSEMEKNGEILIAGALYDVTDGSVNFL
ncbi:MAG: carbonic anhydrase family protein [Bacteroidetes bacterium]|nr:carbonic anhydrase family protein [Bacteroidota bacterium]MDA0938621.1 carbonic anhydrase family protein [Bacteroidota bacterium]MDA1345135.1 carbonic anhydrase family protein [Bacteroidota bacterium]